jgi:ABC-type antimicrobial peptide transport system permease subunit
MGQHMVPVIGVVGDIHNVGLDLAPKPEFYISALQDPSRPQSLAIHTHLDPASLASAARGVIWSLDRNQPITNMATMEEIVDRELSGRQTQTILLGSFAALALLLAAIGLYGVLAFAVGRQIPEIGLRMALGAKPSFILRAVVTRGVRLTLIGTAVGAACAFGVSRLLAALLYGVKSSDPATYVGVALVLLATAAAASYLPARRAMRVDPLEALRQE